MVTDTFEIRSQARNPGAYFALGMAMCLADISWALALPVPGLFAIGFLAVVLRRLATNPVVGFRLSRQMLECYCSRRARVFDLADLAAASIIEAPDGKARCLLHLRNGATAPLPCARVLPVRRLIHEFMRRGIWVSA